jgi:hypothetical protein
VSRLAALRRDGPLRLGIHRGEPPLGLLSHACRLEAILAGVRRPSKRWTLPAPFIRPPFPLTPPPSARSSRAPEGAR